MENIIWIIVILLTDFALYGSEHQDIIQEIFFVKDEIVNEYEEIESYIMEDKTFSYSLSKPTEHESGCISFAYHRNKEDKQTEVFSFNGIDDVKFYELKNESISKVSETGEFYISIKDQNKIVLHKKNGDICYTKNIDDGWLGKVTDTGISIFNPKGDKPLEMHNVNGCLISKLPHFVDPSVYYTNQRTIFAGDKLIACIAGRLFENDEALFPKGSRLFFLNDNYNISNYIEVDGSFLLPNTYVNEDILIYCSYINDDDSNYDNRRIHILKNEREILKLEGNLSKARFSPDGKMVFLDTKAHRSQTGYIIDLEEEKIIKKFESSFRSASIANKGYPYLAYFSRYKKGAQVINYNNGEILCTIPYSDFNDSTFPHFAVHRIQISGNGKEFMAFHKNAYKKFRIRVSD